MTGPNDAGLSCHLAQLEDDILEHLRSYFPREVVPTIDTHDGDFDADAIERYGKRANAIILTANGGKSVRYGGLVNETHVYDLFIMTKGKTVRTRRRAIKLIYEHLLKLLHDNAWTTDECIKTPEKVQSKNLFGSKIDEMGLALWVVRWDQLVQIPYTEDASQLNDFATLYANYLRVGESDPDNTTTEQQITLETD